MEFDGVAQLLVPNQNALNIAHDVLTGVFSDAGDQSGRQRRTDPRDLIEPLACLVG